MALVYLPEKAWSTRYGPEYFTVAIVNVVHADGGYAQYKLLVQNGKSNWYVLRRFSEFDKMRSSLPSMKGHKIPPLPPKSFCCRDLNPDYLARRKNALQVFLEDLLVIPHLAEEKGVRDFLQLPQTTKTFYV